MRLRSPQSMQTHLICDLQITFVFTPNIRAMYIVIMHGHSERKMGNRFLPMLHHFYRNDSTCSVFSTSICWTQPHSCIKDSPSHDPNMNGPPEDSAVTSSTHMEYQRNL